MGMKQTVCDLLVAVLRAHCPYDTGMLSRSIEQTSDFSAVLIGGENAPYAIYTNESWDLFQAPLHGKTNPNEGWIDMAVQEAIPYIRSALEGRTSEQELLDLIEVYNDQYRSVQELYASTYRRIADEI
jgi:hypothetical protein